jgi:hypothetical protein
MERCHGCASLGGQADDSEKGSDTVALDLPVENRAWGAREPRPHAAGVPRRPVVLRGGPRTRPGRKPPLSAETTAQVVHKTLHEKPSAGTHWSIRKMARAVGLGYTSVQRIWKAHDLKPHLVKTFKLSNDKRFVEKVHDIVGLYLNPPNKALVCWYSRSMRRARSKRLIALNRACQ